MRPMTLQEFYKRKELLMEISFENLKDAVKEIIESLATTQTADIRALFKVIDDRTFAVRIVIEERGAEK